MKIKIGYYLTRSGDVVKIEEIVTNGQTRPENFEYHGKYMHKTESEEEAMVASWFLDGGYLPSRREYHRDLIKKISPETHPEYFI